MGDFAVGRKEPLLMVISLGLCGNHRVLHVGCFIFITKREKKPGLFLLEVHYSLFHYTSGSVNMGGIFC